MRMVDLIEKKRDGYKMVGNAVPVEMAHILATKIKEVYFNGKI